MPPAFALSQDQTLRFITTHQPRRNAQTAPNPANAPSQTKAQFHPNQPSGQTNKHQPTNPLKREPSKRYRKPTSHHGQTQQTSPRETKPITIGPIPRKPNHHKPATHHHTTTSQQHTCRQANAVWPQERRQRIPSKTRFMMRMNTAVTHTAIAKMPERPHTPKP